MAGRASYQMYAWPETRAAAQAFWALIREGYGAGDAELTWYDDPEAAWTDPDLLLSQTCGLPFRYRLADRVQLVGTPDYGVPGCAPGHYRSCLVVRADDPRETLVEFRDAAVARNSVQSQSGWAALEAHLQETDAGFRLRERIVETGSHAGSVRAVAGGRADLASIDAVSWEFLQSREPAASALRVLDRTRPTPGLPLITGRGVDADRLFGAVEQAIARLSDVDRDLLRIRGIARIPESAYLSLPLPWPLA